MRLRLNLLSIFLLTTGCTGSVTNSIVQQAKILLSFNNGQISLLSNSTGQQAQCTASNSVVVQTSIPANQTFYCRDNSQLMAGIQTGQVCSGGVTINPLSVPSATVNCANLTLCGVPPTSAITVSTRADGAPVKNLTFSNLPWGCQGSLQYSTDPTFPAASTTTLSTQVIPPNCPFCQTTNSNTCLTCAALGPTQQVVAGQVVWTSCAGGSCSPCTVQTSTGPVSVPHGQGFTFYSAPQNSCPQHCNQLSQLRICNNGLFQGDPQFSIAQCVDAHCGCQLPGSAAIFNSGQSYTLYQTATPQCPNNCSSIQLPAQCLDGTWEDASGNPLSSTQLAAYPVNMCTSPTCNCNIAGRLVPYGTSNVPVYNVSTVSCTDSCAAHQGAVSCSAQGQLTATNPNYLTYTSSQCNPPVCSCPLPWGGSLPNGQSTTAYSVSQATCSNPGACQASGVSVSVTCTNGQLSAFNSQNFKYGSCGPAICSCFADGAQVSIGATAYFYSQQNPQQPLNCQAVSAAFQCQTNGTLTSTGAATIAQYPYALCNSATDQGTLGGTGGGTGNSNGPGSAIKQTYGLGDGGDGSGCMDATGCLYSGVTTQVSPTHPQQPCTLPWSSGTGTYNHPGEIEMYGTIMAFNTQCVVKPDLCSNHRQSRTCHFPQWTGNSTYQFATCVEKASCP